MKQKLHRMYNSYGGCLGLGALCFVPAHIIFLVRDIIGTPLVVLMVTFIIITGWFFFFRAIWNAYRISKEIKQR